jgi:hypothetical protein
MLFILIPLIWLAIATFVVILCRGAASADAMLLTSVEQARARIACAADPHRGARRAWHTHGTRRSAPWSGRTRETRIRH